MRVLVLGGGGREHALCWKIAQSPALTGLWCAPGNAGIAQQAECIAADILDPDAVLALCGQVKADLLVIGPEAPIEAGVSDAARAAGFKVFGPSRAAGMLETSKAFTKEVCAARDVPTARSWAFDDAESAKAHIRSHGAPIVVKADGLAQGKGVVVAEDEEAAVTAVDHIAATPGGARILLEEKLTGEEASFFVLTDGEAAVPLTSARDHKRAFDGDRGPNTGGMGAYSPSPDVTPDVETRIMDEIIHPVLAEMGARGTPYSGVLYAGLMLTTDGPKLIEINARFGDPECQCILPRLTSDLLPVLAACADGTLADAALEWSDDICLTVVMAAQGYPGGYAKGTPIENTAAADAIDGVTVLHAGTALKDGALVSAGGRVLGVTALGGDLTSARSRAYDAVSKIQWKDGFYRSDIGLRAEE